MNLAGDRPDPEEVSSLVCLFHLYSWCIYNKEIPVVAKKSLKALLHSCWYPKRKKNPRKTREKSKTRAQREKMFLYYTMRWPKTRVSRVLLVFCSRFVHKLYQNANPTHNYGLKLYNTLCVGFGNLELKRSKMGEKRNQLAFLPNA